MKKETNESRKKKEDNRNKNTMELPKTGEKYNGLSHVFRIIHGNCKYYRAEKINFNMGSITIYLIQFEQFKL